jgi:hypothetical protein
MFTCFARAEAGVSMMSQVEEPPKAPWQFRFPSRKSKLLLGALLIGIVLLSTLFYLEYRNSTGQYSTLKEHELLQEALKETFHLGHVIVTPEARAFDTVVSDTSIDIVSSNGIKTLGNWSARVVYLAADELVCETRVANNGIFLMPLQAMGRHLIQIDSPSALDFTDHYDTDYAIIARMKNQNDHVPLFAGSRDDYWYSFGGQYEGTNHVRYFYSDP